MSAAAKCSSVRYTRYGGRQCSRAAKRDGYCAQHHPDAVKQRRTASDAKYRAQLAADLTRAATNEAQAKRAADALEALAVEGVADLLADVASPVTRIETARLFGNFSRTTTDEERAALATLAKIARGE